jgi:putative PIN family toxin of toxin-antitoxin system
LIFIFDNNVLISAALLKNSIPDLAFDKAKHNGIILSSRSTLHELFSTLIKEKFDKYTHIETRLEFLFEFKEISKEISVCHSVIACRDPKDNMYLELALSGNANVIVTGDRDLLTLHPFRSIPIVTPKHFLDSFEI